MGERVNIHKAKVHCDCIFNNQRTEFFQRKISGATQSSMDYDEKNMIHTFL